MLAIPERIIGAAGETKRIVWHKPVGSVIADFQRIACSEEEGITAPAPKSEVPLRLDKSGEGWCPTCLARIRADRTTQK